MSTRLFSLAEAAALAGISGPTMTRRLRYGSGPRCQKIGHAKVVAEPDLLVWLSSLRAAA